MPTFQDYPGVSRMHTKSPGPPCGLSNLPVSRAPHQISWSPVQLTNSPDLPCRSSNLPVSCAGHQISWSPMQVIKSSRFERKLSLILAKWEAWWPSILSSSPGRGHCVVFLGKTLNSHSACLHPGVEMGTCDLLGKPNKVWGSDLWWTRILSRGSRNTPSRFILQKPG